MALLATRHIAAAATVLLLGACQTTANSKPVEAMLMQSSPETTTMLSEAVSQALGGVKVTLAPNTLMNKSSFTVETKMAQSMDGNRTVGMMNDRARPMPDRFTLMMQGKDCFLKHEGSGQMMPLGNMNCQAR